MTCQFFKKSFFTRARDRNRCKTPQNDTVFSVRGDIKRIDKKGRTSTDEAIVSCSIFGQVQRLVFAECFSFFRVVETIMMDSINIDNVFEENFVMVLTFAEDNKRKIFSIPS